MIKIPINSQPQTPHEEAIITPQGTTSNQSQRKDSNSTLFSKVGTPNFQSIYRPKKNEKK